MPARSRSASGRRSIIERRGASRRTFVTVRVAPKKRPGGPVAIVPGELLNLTELGRFLNVSAERARQVAADDRRSRLRLARSRAAGAAPRSNVWAERHWWDTRRWRKRPGRSGKCEAAGTRGSSDFSSAKVDARESRNAAPGRGSGTSYRCGPSPGEPRLEDRRGSPEEDRRGRWWVTTRQVDSVVDGRAEHPIRQRCVVGSR